MSSLVDLASWSSLFASDIGDDRGEDFARVAVEDVAAV